MLLAVGAPYAGVPGPAVYLVTRSFEVFTFDGSAEYAAICSAARAPTLLDGELLRRQDDAGTGTGALAVYMMFDAIAIGGSPTGRAHLDKRLAAIGEHVRAPFRTTDDARRAAGAPGLPLYLLGKYFVPKTAVQVIFAAIHEERGAAAPRTAVNGTTASSLLAPLESELGGGGASLASAHRTYRHDIRVNGTDGVVFTPVRASYLDQFQSGRLECTLPLLKWKFADENTVDFRLRRSDLESGSSGSDAHVLLPLHLNSGRERRGGPDVEIAVARTAVPVASADAYLALMDRLGVDSLIVEAGYDRSESMWRIRRIRDRKTRANHIVTGWQTLEIAAENVTAAEIVECLSHGSSGAYVARGGASGGADTT